MKTSALAMPIPGNETNEIASLVRRARGGDRDAFGDLVERLWAELVALARGVLAADDEVEDLVQEALVHAWKRLWTLRRPESFRSWMRRIVTRRCLTAARRRRPQEPLAETAAGPSPMATVHSPNRSWASHSESMIAACSSSPTPACPLVFSVSES